MSKIKQSLSFFRHVMKEMRKVSWLSQKDLYKDTAIVILFVFFMLVFFGVSDFLISNTLKLIFK